jgi:hypothetical protein
VGRRQQQQRRRRQQQRRRRRQRRRQRRRRRRRRRRRPRGLRFRFGSECYTCYRSMNHQNPPHPVATLGHLRAVRYQRDTKTRLLQNLHSVPGCARCGDFLTRITVQLPHFLHPFGAPSFCLRLPVTSVRMTESKQSLSWQVGALLGLGEGVGDRSGGDHHGMKSSRVAWPMRGEEDSEEANRRSGSVAPLVGRAQPRASRTATNVNHHHFLALPGRAKPSSRQPHRRLLRERSCRQQPSRSLCRPGIPDRSLALDGATACNEACPCQPGCFSTAADPRTSARPPRALACLEPPMSFVRQAARHQRLLSAWVSQSACPCGKHF